jgi:thiol-disulfide isomerase/thioredoxin
VLWNVVALVAVLVVATTVGLLVRRNAGHFRGAAKPDRGSAADGSTNGAGDDRGTTIDPADLPHPLGERATLLQFSSAFCAPCRATRRILGEVAAMVPGVRHVEVDAEHHLDLVRRVGVLRTPTTLVLDASGREVKRATGAPTKADVLAALGLAIEGASGTSQT